MKKHKVSKTFNNGKMGWNEIAQIFKASKDKPTWKDYDFLLWLTAVSGMAAFLTYFCLK